MPILENAKHEAFANHLARGLKQAEAYAQAGYTPNPPAASRLAKSVAIKTRVEELKAEIHQKIQVAMTTPNEETFGTLKEMGLTMDWVANAYKNIYEESVAAGQYAPANAAVKNIQTLIEIENNGKTEDDVQDKPKVELSEVTAMLKEMRGIINATKDQDVVEMVDVTPPDEPPVVNPPKLLDIPEVDDDHA